MHIVGMKRTIRKLPDDLDAKATREATESHLEGGVRRKLVAAKAGRSGSHDTARRIEEIMRKEPRRSR